MFAMHGKKGQKLDQNAYVNVSGPQFVTTYEITL